MLKRLGRGGLVVLLLLIANSAANALPVFLLVGQSNMVGRGIVTSRDNNDGALVNGTLEYLLQDPRTAHAYRRDGLWDKDNWKVFDQIKIWKNKDSSNKESLKTLADFGPFPVAAKFGNLTVGYGMDETRIGPELGFGIRIQRGLKNKQKFVILKLAWDGMTLATDFRSPTSTQQYDPYCFEDGKEPNCNPSQVGLYYQVLVQNLKALLEPGKLAEYFPDTVGLHPKIVGMGWFHGWNDGCHLNYTASYETNLVNFITDLRRELQQPFPVVIAVSGFAGYMYGVEESRHPPDCWITAPTQCHCIKPDTGCRRIDMIVSQVGAANRLSRALAVETRSFFRQAEYSPNTTEVYHWYHNAETMYLVGKAMGRGMLALWKKMKLENKVAQAGPKTWQETEQGH